MARWWVLGCGLLVGVGCRKIDPAPTELDDLAHYFWDRFDDADPTQVAAGVASLHAAIDADNLDGPVDGTVSDLRSSQLGIVGKEGEDASAAAGVYMANVIDCPLDKVRPRIYALNQDEQHPGSYEAYARSYTTEVDAFEAGEVDSVGWETNYTVAYLGNSYSATIDGDLRSLPEVDEEITPHGESFLVRGVLREPAPYDDDPELGLFQDYQLEVYYGRSAQETVHFYVIWREFQFTEGSGFDDEVVQRFVLNGLSDWDKDIEGLCADR